MRAGDSGVRTAGGDDIATVVCAGAGTLLAVRVGDVVQRLRGNSCDAAVVQLGLVTRAQMVNALAAAVLGGAADGVRIVETAGIRQARMSR